MEAKHMAAHLAIARIQDAALNDTSLNIVGKDVVKQCADR